MLRFILRSQPLFHSKSILTCPYRFYSSKHFLPLSNTKEDILSRKRNKRVDLFSQTEAGTVTWSSTCTNPNPTPPNTNDTTSVLNVPDFYHQGIGTIDEGIDGLREAGFINDGDIPYQSMNSSTNVYAIDDQYKQLAFTILDMTEQDFNSPHSNLNPNSSLHDSITTASSFTDMTSEVVPDPHVINHNHSLLSSDDSNHLLSNHWRPINPIPIHNHLSHFSNPLSSSHSNSHRLIASQTNIPGGKRSLHSFSSLSPSLGLRHYTVVSGWDVEYLGELESGQFPSNLESLRSTLIQAGATKSMYSAEDLAEDLSSLISPEEDAVRASSIY